MADANWTVEDPQYPEQFLSQRDDIPKEWRAGIRSHAVSVLCTSGVRQVVVSVTPKGWKRSQGGVSVQASEGVGRPEAEWLLAQVLPHVVEFLKKKPTEVPS
jgi:hypothetical protein